MMYSIVLSTSSIGQRHVPLPITRIVGVSIHGSSLHSSPIKVCGEIIVHLFCERDLYIETMEERFAKFKDVPGDKINLSHWAEPGRYEGNMGLTIRETELFAPNPPNIMFSHETGLSFGNLGKRKRLGDVRATEIPYWGKADDIIALYE